MERLCLTPEYVGREKSFHPIMVLVVRQPLSEGLGNRKFGTSQGSGYLSSDHPTYQPCTNNHPPRGQKQTRICSNFHIPS